MGTQVLGAKKTRKIARITGLDIARAWTHGVHFMFAFVTDDHEHGWVDIRTGEWGINDDPVHYTSCDEMWPGYREEANV